MNIFKISQGGPAGGNGAGGDGGITSTINDKVFFNAFRQIIPRLQWKKESDEAGEDMGVLSYNAYVGGRETRWLYRLQLKSLRENKVEMKVEARVLNSVRTIATVTLSRDIVVAFVKRNFLVDIKAPVPHEEILPPGAIRGVKMGQKQDFGQYYQGEIPDYLGNLVGTPSVDTSRLSAGTINVDKAVQMVNSFDGSLLKNISVIFNSADSGSYGVYVPSLDRAIKTKALQKMLEQKGYKIVDENGVLTAYPKQEDKDPQDIDADIKTLYSHLESQGGTVFGINMNKVIEAAKSDPANQESPYPKLWELLAVLHLGATIVHEAVHAKGATDEGPSESVEHKFMQWALPKINEEYLNAMKSLGQEDQFSPIEIGDQVRHASSNSWYKFSQSYYMPQSFLSGKPTGSDLDGRHNRGVPGGNSNGGMADWAKMSNPGSGDAIESRLGRQFMSPLPKGLSQDNDVTELQLRKYTAGDIKLDPKLVTEQLLAKDRIDNLTPYMTIEQMMEENRPSPLLTTIQKEASSQMLKTATLFGWMNNLTISDGSTIPGLGDRVMAWEDRDEDFAEEEDWIKEQPRYNPCYDIKGFFYRYIEPRFQPQLFDDMTKDVVNTHPAKRFASENEGGIYFIMSVLNNAARCLKSKKINATRFIMSEDMCAIMQQFAKANKLNIYTYAVEDEQEDMYACWLTNKGCDEKAVESFEGKLRLKKTDAKEISKIFGEPSHHGAIAEVIKCSERVCREYNIDDLYLVGSYAREKLIGKDEPVVSELNFNSSSARQNMQIGQLMAEKLGVRKARLYTKTMTYSFVYKGVKVDFYGGYVAEPIEKMMKAKGLDSSDMLLADVCNRDFTVNMAMYNVKSKIVSYPIEEANAEVGVLKTFFDPSVILQMNPIVAIRAMDMCINSNVQMDEKLEVAIMEVAPKLRDEKYQGEIERLCRQNPEKMERYLNEYGIKENENANSNQT